METTKDKRFRHGTEHPNFGRKQSAETAEKKRSWMLENAPNRGKSMPDETKQKLREARSRQWHPKFVERGITREAFEEATSKGLRWCSGECKAFLPGNLFCPRQQMCRKCNASYVHAHKNKKKFGLSTEEYRGIVDVHDGLCDICRNKQIGGDRLCIDHDHKTGKIRGLLCRPCNFVVERLDNVPAYVESALTYLAKYSK